MEFYTTVEMNARGEWKMLEGGATVATPNYLVDGRTFEEVVEMALSGALDSPATRFRPAHVCVAVIRDDGNSTTTTWTGLVRRCREGRPGADDAFIAHVRKYRSFGDISPRRNITEGLSPRAKEAVEYLVSRAYAGVASQLARVDGIDHEEVDRSNLERFDREVPLPL